MRVRQGYRGETRFTRLLCTGTGISIIIVSLEWITRKIPLVPGYPGRVLLQHYPYSVPGTGTGYVYCVYWAGYRVHKTFVYEYPVSRYSTAV